MKKKKRRKKRKALNKQIFQEIQGENQEDIEVKNQVSVDSVSGGYQEDINPLSFVLIERNNIDAEQHKDASESDIGLKELIKRYQTDKTVFYI